MTTMQDPTNCEICKVDVPNNWTSHILGKKHRKGVELLEKIKDAEEKGIYVTGFPGKATQEHLQAFFSQFGQIEKFIYGSRGNFTIVQFCERRSAQMCLSKQLFFYGYPLRVKRREFRAQPNRRPAPEATPGGDLDHSQITTALSSCEDNFESQLSALQNEIHLSDYSKHVMVCRHLEATFSDSFRGCKAHPFGSAVTGLAFKGSDLDVFMDLNGALDLLPERGNVNSPVQESRNGIINNARRLLCQRSHLYGNVFAIPKAKTPIVKFVHQPTKISCDLSFKNALGVNNSALIKFYLSMDPRLKPLLIIIKYWVKKNDLSGHGKISNYALVMITLFYVQQLENPIIPTVATLQKGVNNRMIIDGWDCSINNNFLSSNSNTMPVPELLCGFFKFFSLFDYGMKVICPLIGMTLPKSVFQTPEELPESMHCYKEYMSGTDPNILGLKVDSDMCVQDPFELRHNLTVGMSAKALVNFKNYCEAAANACIEELASTDLKAPSFLRKLFDETTKPPLVMSWCNEVAYITIPLGKYLAPTLPEEKDLAQQNSADTEDELREKWYKLVLEFLIEIFENIMKFEIQVEEPEHNSKIQKLEGQSDVCNKMLDSEGVKLIHCSGFFRIWEGRKSASKKVTFPEKMVAVMRERTISDYLFERFKQQSSTCDLITTFLCTFRPKQEPTRVILELSDKKSCKGDFKVLAAYLQGRLPVWIEKCMKQQYDEKKDVNAPSLTKEQQSSSQMKPL